MTTPNTDATQIDVNDLVQQINLIASEQNMKLISDLALARAHNTKLLQVNNDLVQTLEVAKNEIDGLRAELRRNKENSAFVVNMEDIDPTNT